MSNHSVVCSPISRPILQKIQTYLFQKFGKALAGDSGEAESKDKKYDIHYEYTEANQTLVLTVIHKPGLVPEFAVENTLRDWVKEAQAS